MQFLVTRWSLRASIERYFEDWYLSYTNKYMYINAHTHNYSSTHKWIFMSKRFTATSMATPEEGRLQYKGQVPNEQFVYKTTPQQSPPPYKGHNFVSQHTRYIHCTASINFKHRYWTKLTYTPRCCTVHAVWPHCFHGAHLIASRGDHEDGDFSFPGFFEDNLISRHNSLCVCVGVCVCVCGCVCVWVYVCVCVWVCGGVPVWIEHNIASYNYSSIEAVQ